MLGKISYYKIDPKATTRVGKAARWGACRPRSSAAQRWVRSGNSVPAGAEVCVVVCACVRGGVSTSVWRVSRLLGQPRLC